MVINLPTAHPATFLTAHAGGCHDIVAIGVGSVARELAVDPDAAIATDGPRVEDGTGVLPWHLHMKWMFDRFLSEKSYGDFHGNGCLPLGPSSEILDWDDP